MTSAIPRAFGVCAWGFVVAKVAAAAVDVAGGSGLVVVPAFLAGFLGDAIVLLLVLALARFLPRTALAIGALVGLYSVLNVYLVAAFGSPLTAPMLAYRKDADAGVLATAPLVIALSSITVFAIGAWPFAALVSRVRMRVLLAVLAALVVAGAVVPLVDDSGSVRSLGLDRNALALLVTTALPSHASDDARTPWDAPWPAPTEARFTAPVDVDTAHGRPKHIVIWLAESTGARHTSLYGGPENTTPTLEKLRAHSLRFLHYDANAPVSAKAIFATLCGLYPSPEAEFEARTHPRIACPSLMETLTKVGFDASLFHGGYFAFTDKLQLLEERGFDLMLDGESIPDREKYFTNGWGVDDQAIVDHGLAWIDARANPSAPSLQIYIPLLPHYEYFMPPKAPKPFGDGTLLQRYENGVHYSDQLFGELVDGYAARGLLDDTVFVFVGDHGEAFEEHPRNKLHAGFLYEENVQAPLVIYAPKLFDHEQTSDRLGSHVDLAATLLDLVGVDAPAQMQGQSLVSDRYRYRPILLQTWYPDPLVGLRDGDKKYIRNLNNHVEELYDLARDPGEKHNLAAAFPEVTRGYRARLADFVVRQKELIASYPQKGEGFLERSFAALEAKIVDDNGTEIACTHTGDRVLCPGTDVTLALAQERVFNMERRCLRVNPPPTGSLTISLTTSPPVRTVGIGLTDKARFSKGAPLHARFSVEGQEPFELVVDDTFETTSKMRSLAKASSSSSSTVSVEISSKGKNRSACLTLAP